jgi:2-oxoglutarate dehydrogenase E2 component (dihydrolipoamide succinyltransferase)
MNQSINIILPAAQLEGTSATLTKWLVAIGASVTQGDPIIELETDKVSMEICAPESGVISEIIASEDEEVEVDTVLGKIIKGQADNNTSAESIAAAVTEEEISSTPGNITVLTEQADNSSARNSVGPAVRRLLSTHNLNLKLIAGTGRRGRVTRNDILAYVAEPSSRQREVEADQQVVSPSVSMPYSLNQPTARASKSTTVPHTNMRKAIANHMVNSLLETSPHVTSVFEMDMTNIIEHRKWHKKEFAQQGTKLTFTAYFLAAVVEAVHTVPQVNARFHDDGLELFSDINIGVGTALGDDGLVVPVVQQVQSMSLFDIANALTIQTEKARTGKITPADMKYGTFTISNHGVSGSLFATPIIINQPQVAILGVGKLEKRVVVEEVAGVDTMVIRPKCYVSLSIDHRALDAHQTNMFLAKFVEVIEAWGE